MDLTLLLRIGDDRMEADGIPAAAERLLSDGNRGILLLLLNKYCMSSSSLTQLGGNTVVF